MTGAPVPLSGGATRLPVPAWSGADTPALPLTPLHRQAAKPEPSVAHVVVRSIPSLHAQLATAPGMQLLDALAGDEPQLS